MKLYAFAFNPNKGVAYWVFLKILKLCATLFSGKDKIPYTADGVIAIRRPWHMLRVVSNFELVDYRLV